MSVAAMLIALAAPVSAGTLLDQPPAPATAEMVRGPEAPADGRTDPFTAAIASYQSPSGWIRAPDRHDIAVFLDAFLRGAGLLAIVYALIHGHALLGRRSSRR